MSAIVYYPGYAQTQVQENLRVQTIASITNQYNMIVTTVNNHGYIVGMKVTFLVPQIFGMIQLNNMVGQVIALTPNTLTVNIDSTHFTPFSYPSPMPAAYTVPSIIPYASGPYLPITPLLYGNQTSFDGTVFNNGLPNDPIDGV